MHHKLPHHVSEMALNKFKDLVKPELINKVYYNTKDYISDTNPWR